jgi:hypothetical protein
MCSDCHCQPLPSDPTPQTDPEPARPAKKVKSHKKAVNHKKTSGVRGSRKAQKPKSRHRKYQSCCEGYHLARRLGANVL